MKHLLLFLFFAPGVVYAQETSIGFMDVFRSVGPIGLYVQVSGPIGPKEVIESIVLKALEDEGVSLGGGGSRYLSVRLDGACQTGTCSYYIELALREPVTVLRGGQDIRINNAVTWQRTYFEGVVGMGLVGDRVGQSIDHLIRTEFAHSYKVGQKLRPDGTTPKRAFRLQ